MVKLIIPQGTSHEEAMRMIENCENLTELQCYNTQIQSLPDMPLLTELYCGFMNTDEYKKYIKKCRALLTLSSIQTLRLNSNTRLKNIDPNGFNLARLVKKML